ncbi:hypothetical protein BJX70DRAFT_401024 [Aspergillus crustosus]
MAPRVPSPSSREDLRLSSCVTLSAVSTGCSFGFQGPPYDKAMLNVAWDYSWDDPADDNLFYSLAASARNTLDSYAKLSGNYIEYIYLNYADRTQNPLAGYGADNLDFLRSVAAKYDPQGVFQRLVPGGFKVSRA